jgi:hypothetical protein
MEGTKTNCLHIRHPDAIQDYPYLQNSQYVLCAMHGVGSVPITATTASNKEYKY